MPRKKTSGSPADRRERLIRVARKLVRTGGMAALSLRTLAERDGSSTQAIYTLFGGKPGLVQAIYGHWIDDLEKRILDAPTADPATLMRHTARLYREHALADPDLFLAGSASAEVIELLHRSRAFHLFAGLVRAGMDQGLFRASSDASESARSLWAAVHGAVLFEVCSPEKPRTATLLEETVSLLLDGLARKA